MKKYNNTSISIVFILIAPLLLLFMDFLSKIMPFTLFVILYVISLVIGIFFGWRSLKLKESPILGNLVTLFGIFALLGGIVYLYWIRSWGL